MSEFQPPTYFGTVVVPVASPKTALPMLRLGLALVDPENGKLLALRVITDADDKEETSEDIDELEAIIERFAANGHQMEVVTQVASSITRGILDGAREHGAELLIMGVRKAGERNVKLGSLVENIVEAAPCDLLVYRPVGKQQYERLFVPLDGSQNSLTALNDAILIAKKNKLHLHVMYIQRDYNFYGEREKIVRKMLGELDADFIHKDIITGATPAQKILDQLDENNLLIVGFQQKSDFSDRLTNELTNTLLNHAPGSVLMASRLITNNQDTMRGRLWGQVWRRLQRFNPALTQAERNEMVWEARKTGMSTVDYLVLILLSAALASLGLLLNSVAVIIGAMLVAPLMSPLGALATGLSTGHADITTRSAFTLIEGFLLSVVVSFAMGELLFIDVPTSEMLSRGTPSLLDAAVAMASGLVAAFALARREIPAALAGVAIAAALMPPVCTIGLGLAVRNPALAGGATLLFFTNIVFIVVSEYLVLLWLGMRPGRREDAPYIRVWWTVIIGLLIVVVTLLVQLTQDAQRTSEIQDFLEQRMTNIDVIDITSDEVNNGLSVLLTVRTNEMITSQQVENLQAQLSEAYDMPVNFDIATVQIVDARSPRERQIMEIVGSQSFIVQVMDVAVQVSGQDDEVQFTIDATVRTTRELTASDVQSLTAILTDELGAPVSLSLVPQPVISAESTREPASTPDS